MVNIAEILKNKPVRTKLWSPLLGNCTLKEIKEDIMYPIVVMHHNNISSCFTKYGQYLSDFEEGECLLFPSKYMRNWEKFSWKKGNVLTNKDNTKMCVFDGWYKDDYTQIKAKHWLDCKNENNHKYFSDNQPLTSLMHLAKPDEAKCYINTIEERLGGKLSLETLEIEKPKYSFKPFDKVLVRSYNDLPWKIDLFNSFESNYNYPYCCLGAAHKQCIPYEGNEHLLGTTNSPT